MAEPSTARIFCPCGVEIFRTVSASGRGGRPPTYCTDCKASRQRAAVRAAGARVRAGIPAISSFLCGDCKQSFPRQGKTGPIPSRCKECSTAYEILRMKTWAIENPEKIFKNSVKGRRKRRALLRGAETEDFDAVDIYERDGWRCQLCYKKVDKRLKWPHRMSASLDHQIPLSRGGGHVRKNVTLAHVHCNRVKNNRAAGEQLMLIG